MLLTAPSFASTRPVMGAQSSKNESEREADMADFSDSNWADSEFSREYLAHAGAYVPFRGVMIDLMRSHCLHFIKGDRKSVV